MVAIRKKFGFKIKFSETPLPKFMFGIIDASGLLEVDSNSADNKEAYILLFETKELAQSHIDKMNTDFWVSHTGEKVFWYANRNNTTIEINTSLTRFKSKYVPLQYAINKLLYS